MRFPTLSIFVAALAFIAPTLAQESSTSAEGCNHAGCGTAQIVSETATATSEDSGCNHPGCGTAQIAAFAAATPIPVAQAAIVGFGVLGAAVLL